MSEKFITLKLSDWTFNAGVVGFYKILQKYHIRDELKNKLIIYKDKIEFSPDLLNNFSLKYFKFFHDTYGEFMPYGKILKMKSKYENLLNKDFEITEKNIDKLNKDIDFIKKKIESNSYKSIYKYIDSDFEFEKQVKQFNKPKFSEKTDLNILKNKFLLEAEKIVLISDNMNKDNVLNFFYAKDFIYAYTNDFLQNISLWGKEGSKYDPFKMYNNDFVNPLKNYISAEQKDFKDYCICCNNKINKSNFGFNINFVNATGVDSAKKPSHFYNFYSDVVICPICYFIYSCIPAGFIYLNKKGFFVNVNNDLEGLLKANAIINSAIKTEQLDLNKLEYETYFTIAKIFENESNKALDKEIENIQVVKMDSNNERRPFSFNHMDRKKAFIIYKASKILGSLVRTKVNNGNDIYIYEEVVKRIFNDGNMYDLLILCINLKLDSKVNSFLLSQLFNIQKIIFIIKHSKEGVSMEKTIEYCKHIGLELQSIYKNKSSDNKIDTITYKALNALKTKNSGKFLDIIINSYMYVGKEIPTVFTNVLKSDENLLILGYAFIVGLQGDINNKKEEK